MRIDIGVFVALLTLASTACRGPSLGPEQTPTLTTPPDLSATVANAWYESAYGPAGPYAQFDVWLAVPPSATPNAGVVLPMAAPVLVRWNGRTYAASGNDIAVGDRVRVWVVPQHVAYGAVQGPPGAPTYTGTQLVIDR